MTVADLVRLFDYSYWANRRLLGTIAQLAPDQFTQEIGGSYGSIRNTLVHIMSAEWGWLDRCGGPARGPGPEIRGLPDAGVGDGSVDARRSGDAGISRRARRR